MHMVRSIYEFSLFMQQGPVFTNTLRNSRKPGFTNRIEHSFNFTKSLNRVHVVILFTRPG